MGRAERLLELTDRLRATAETTVDALAAELGVSARTLRRDLATLRDRGMPITGQAGPGGGVRLDGRRGVTAVHLSIGEVVALWLAARLSQASGELPWSSRASSALAKLLGSLSRERARELRDLCGRVFVGPAATASVQALAGAAPRELLPLLEEAMTTGVGLGFRYRDRNGRTSTRRVEPHGLLVQPPVWYVLARDLERGAPRMFRMDRLSHPRLLRDVRFRADAAVARALLAPDVDWQPLLRPRAGA
jgi:predicted DNA-binding transcriptional regulator YafY